MTKSTVCPCHYHQMKRIDRREKWLAVFWCVFIVVTVTAFTLLNMGVF